MSRKKKRAPETARIESVTHDGRGIAAVTGKKVFVTGALEGEPDQPSARRLLQGSREHLLGPGRLVEPEPQQTQAVERVHVVGLQGDSARAAALEGAALLLFVFLAMVDRSS